MRLLATHTKTGEVREFTSMKEASMSCNIASANISQCLHGKKKSAAGFTWQRITEPTPRKSKNNAPEGWLIKKKKGILIHLYSPDKRHYYSKQAVYYPNKKILQVFYNHFVPLTETEIPNLDKMQVKLKDRLQSCYGKCIVIYYGSCSNRKKEDYYLYTEITMKSENTPTPKTLRHIENEITNNLIYKKREKPQKSLLSP